MRKLSSAAMGLACLLAIALSQAIAADQQVGIGASLSLTGKQYSVQAGRLLVAHAARHDAKASDGTGPNGRFIASLLRDLEPSGLEINFVFRHVRDDVIQAAGHKPDLFVYRSLSRQAIDLVPAVAGSAGATVRSKAAPSDETARVWNEAKATLTPRVEQAAPCGSVEGTMLPASRVALPLSRAEECALRPKDVFKECDKCAEMVVVPAGSFTMGSPVSEQDRRDNEGPQHVVTIARPFAVGRFQVTVEQFAAFVAETGHDVGSSCWTFEDGKPQERQGRSWRNPGFAQAGKHPAVCLSWADATAYVDWMSRKTGKTYRLLSEAEWEYAARARTEPAAYPRYWFGNEEKDLCRYANAFDQEAKSKIPGTSGWTIAPCNDGHAYTAPAGSFPANGFGLYDMAGNAWQWTADCWNESYKGALSDGSAWVAGDCGRRVLRGGSWINSPRVLRAANRDRNAAGLRYGFNGFQLARTLTP